MLIKRSLAGKLALCSQIFNWMSLFPEKGKKPPKFDHFEKTPTFRGFLPFSWDRYIQFKIWLHTAKLPVQDLLINTQHDMVLTKKIWTFFSNFFPKNCYDQGLNRPILFFYSMSLSSTNKLEQCIIWFLRVWQCWVKIEGPVWQLCQL